MAKIYAIANCRVSSDEQLLSNSLARQEKSVFSAATRLNAEIIQVWSGSVSSKAGTNVNRKDLMAMLETCKKNKSIKFAIFDEYDRFMRSVNEGPYFEVMFQQVGVKVWYASESDAFNGDDAMAKFMRTMSAYKAEGSNEERQRKSINGQTAALKDGRYTFHPKPGYKKGTVAGVHEVHEVRGRQLQKVLRRLAAGYVNPTNALIELNNSKFTNDHAPLKMDKFRRYATDVYYAGILEMDKQVKVKNVIGLHEALITIEEHRKLVEIFDNKPKYQIGPKRNGNPKFPLNNLMEHRSCTNLKNRGRLVGFDHTNGKYKKIYQKYRCRSCNHYWHKNDVDAQVTDLFNRYEMTPDTQKKILKALEIVWTRDDKSKLDKIRSIGTSISSIKKSIDQKVESATDESNIAIKDDILRIIEKKKNELSGLESELERLQSKDEEDREQFMKFALDFIQDTGRHFLEPALSKEYRIMCKQMLFPAGIYIDQDLKVYTPEISAFYRGTATKKDTEVSELSQMVRVRRL